MIILKNIYNQLGGTFVTPIELVQERLKNIKAFVFDWDGVFNNGQKDASGGSNFSEVDSMGTNLLRYSCFLLKKQLPITAVISGEKNETAFYFCERECFNYSFFKISNKKLALEKVCTEEKISPHEVAYFFDDVLDLPIAEVCGLRILVNQKANPLFLEYCKEFHLVDYATAHSGGHYAVREACELLMALNGNYAEVLNSRKKFDSNYDQYIKLRREVKTQFFTVKENEIIVIQQGNIGFGK
jgi:3-deoxy-D-manno-octulosonate 8-phosphate phosphatase (KDO 8-P phosphatase)